MAFLTVNERFDLVEKIRVRDDFVDIRGRQLIVYNAGLDRFLGGIDLQGAPKQVAGALVMKLEKYGPLPKPETYHALGALLAYLIQDEETTPEQKASFAKLMVRYSLSSDPDQIDSLRKEYNIQETVARPPDQPENEMPSAFKAAVKSGPSFDPSAQVEKGLESIINSADNFLDLYVLTGALECSRAVCLVEIPQGRAVGTGFLVAPDYVLTNQHVIPEKDLLKEVTLRFDYVADSKGGSTSGRLYKLDPDFYQSSDEKLLDYALVKTIGQPLDDLVKAGKHRGYLILADRRLAMNERVNIIQHPKGGPQKVVLTQNYVAQTTDTRLQYVADTLDGSSGSPVFDKNWGVVALHHSGEPYPPESAFDTAKKLLNRTWRVNEGIPIKAILKEVGKFLPPIIS